jgi:hypothetical protein
MAERERWLVNRTARILGLNFKRDADPDERNAYGETRSLMPGEAFNAEHYEVPQPWIDPPPRMDPPRHWLSPATPEEIAAAKDGTGPNFTRLSNAAASDE